MNKILSGTAKSLEVAVNRTARWVNTLGLFLVLAMAILLVIDITLRTFFNRPIPFTIELEQFMLIWVVFLGLAWAGIEKAHVSIDLLHRNFPEWMRAIFDCFTCLLGIAVFFLIAWQTFLFAANTMHSGEVGNETGWPLWIFMLVMSFGSSLMCLVLLVDLIHYSSQVKNSCRWPALCFPVIGIAAAALITSPAWLEALSIEIASLTAGIIGIALMVVLMMIKMPIAFCMALVGFIGMWYIRGTGPALTMVASGAWHAATQYLLVVVPLFILMGMFAYHARISGDLYKTAYTWFGHLPGGLAMATVAACAGFAAISGSSTATAATMATVAIPEMRKFNYAHSLATGVVAASGTLGILIPPSIGFVVYALLTEASIGKLFIAGIIPGILHASVYMTSIFFRCRANPQLGPRGPATSFIEKLKSFKGTWTTVLLFGFVMGGIYFGIVTVTEAAALGAFGAFAIAIALRRLSRKGFADSLLETGKLTAMIFTILVGVRILGYFVAISNVSLELSNLIISLEFSRYVILVAILFSYLVLGMLMNIIPMIMLTLPIMYPTILALGFDPIWFGVIMVVMMEVGQVTPPVGITVFVVAGVVKDIPMSTIFKGILPFWACDIAVVTILVLFPQIALFLPGMMK